jgi:hypothetical protein
MHMKRNFHEGHSTVGEWQGSSRVVAEERHGMCESAFRDAMVSANMCTRVLCCARKFENNSISNAFVTAGGS